MSAAELSLSFLFSLRIYQYLLSLYLIYSSCYLVISLQLVLKLISPSFSGTSKQVTDLLNEGAILNTYSRHDFTALHLAIFMRNVDVVKVLAAKGADVSAQGTLGVTPLHLAALTGLREVMCNGARGRDERG
eukprot:sb/3474990/